MIRLSVAGIVACAILSACSNHQPAGYGGAPGGWSPGASPRVRTVAEPKILPETFYAAGQLFEAQGLLTKAAVQYRKAAAVNHSFAAAYDRLGVTLGRLGKHPSALEALQTAVKLGPDSAPFHNNLAFEYVLLGGLNDTEEHAAQLGRLLRGRPALLNVIPYNPVTGLPYRVPSHAAQRRFREVLEAGGLNVRFRQRKGDEINAACGQLRRRTPSVVPLDRAR